MRDTLTRLWNEPAFVGTAITVIFDGLVVFDVLDLTLDQFGYINAAVVILFGAATRKMAYGPKTGQALEAKVDYLSGELLDQ